MNAKNTFKKSKHPIQVAARRSGVTPDVIRAWERRYEAVTPERSGTNRRLYSDEDVERLLLLGQVTRAGRRIGDVAGLSMKELAALVAADHAAAAKLGASPIQEPKSSASRTHLAAAVEAVRRLDSAALQQVLATASVDLAPTALLDQLVKPLLTTVGEEWHRGSMRVAHEHLATAMVRSFLGAQRSIESSSPSAPEIIVATPAGQRHELGGLTVAISLASDGWRTTFLGSDLPAEEIAAAALTRQARAVALSIIYPADDPHLAGEIRNLRAGLGADVLIVIGGESASAYRDVIEEVGARLIPDVEAMSSELRAIRTSTPDVSSRTPR